VRNAATKVIEILPKGPACQTSATNCQSSRRRTSDQSRKRAAGRSRQGRGEEAPDRQDGAQDDEHHPLYDVARLLLPAAVAVLEALPRLALLELLPIPFEAADHAQIIAHPAPFGNIAPMNPSSAPRRRMRYTENVGNIRKEG
jgi:hypothetical protein